MQHAAGQRPSFVDLDLVAASGQVIGGRQSARAGADDQDALAGGSRHGHRPAFIQRHVTEEALDRVDRHRGVEFTAIAGGFAGVIADPPVRRRQRVVGYQGLPRAAILTCLRKRQPGLDVLPGGAGVIAGRLQRDVVWQPGAERPGAVMKRQIDRRGQIVRGSRRGSLVFVHAAHLALCPLANH